MWSDKEIRYAIERIYEACANYDKQKEKECREFYITNNEVFVAFRNAYAKFYRSRNANGEK